MSHQGNYDAESELLIKLTNADLVGIIVLNGKEGSGFSVSTINPKLINRLAEVLELAAAEIRAGKPVPR